MELLLWIILFSLLGGLLSVLMASLILLVPDVGRGRMINHMVSFAIGALLGGAFLAVIPHALASPEVQDYHNITLAILLGLLGFFILEKLVLWRHCHSEHCETHGIVHGHDHDHDHDKDVNASRALIIIGDGLHNFVDGILITAAFLTDFHLGVITSIAIALHEVPQEIGDFAILLQSGLSRSRALVLNLASGLAAVAGAVLAWFFLSEAQHIIPYVLAVAAASFIYIAVADLIPGLHKSPQLGATVTQVTLISAGVLIIWFSHSMVH